MLYLIGGPGRSGKTTLALRLLKHSGIAYFSLDYLMMGIYRAHPETGVNPNRPEAEVAPLLWPAARGVIRAMAENGEEYCVEGFCLGAEQIAEMRAMFPEVIRGCCLGYCSADPAEKLRLERTHPTTNPWPMDRDITDALAEFALQREASIRLRKDCTVQGVEFFDTGDGFEEMINAAAEYLVGDTSAPIVNREPNL